VYASYEVVGIRVSVDSGRLAAYAFDAQTGRRVWRYQIGSWVASSPAVSGNMMVVGAFDGNVYGFTSSASRTVRSARSHHARALRAMRALDSLSNVRRCDSRPEQADRLTLAARSLLLRAAPSVALHPGPLRWGPRRQRGIRGRYGRSRLSTAGAATGDPSTTLSSFS